MRHTAKKRNVTPSVVLPNGFFQFIGIRAIANNNKLEGGSPGVQLLCGTNQPCNALPREKSADEAQRRGAVQTQACCQSIVSHHGGKTRNVHSIGNMKQFVCRNSTTLEVIENGMRNSDYRVGTLCDVRFQTSGEPVTHGRSTSFGLIHCGVFPKRTNLIDERKPTGMGYLCRRQAAKRG